MKRPSVSFDKEAIGRFFLLHTEKIVATIVAVAAAWMIWQGITAIRFQSVRPGQAPEDVSRVAQAAQEHIGAVAEPPKDILSERTPLPKEMAEWRMAKPAQPPPRALFDKPLFEEFARRTQPKVLPLEKLQAVTGVAVLAPKAGEVANQPASPAGQPAAAGRARIVPYVMVTGLIPSGQQQAEYRQRFAEVGHRDAKRDVPLWSDYELDRGVVAADGNVKWEPVDLQAVLRQRSGQWGAPVVNQVPPAFQLGPGEDGRSAKTTPFAFCGSLPPRIDGAWGDEQFHPWVLDKLKASARRPGAEKPREPAAGLVEAAPEGGPAFATPAQPDATEPAPPQAAGEPPVVPEYRQFRFIDTAVEPGVSYRYRVRLKVWNPNWKLEPQHVADESLVVAPQLVSPDSASSGTVTVPDPTVLLVGRIDAAEAKRLKLKPGTFEVFVLGASEKTGDYALRSLLTEVGGLADVGEQASKSAEQRGRGEKITTGRVLVDVLGQQVDPAELSPTRGGRQAKQSAGPAEPLEMLFARPDGGLEFVSAAESEERIRRYRATLGGPAAENPGPEAAPVQPFGAPINPFGTPPPRPNP